MPVFREHRAIFGRRDIGKVHICRFWKIFGNMGDIVAGVAVTTDLCMDSWASQRTTASAR